MIKNFIIEHPIISILIIVFLIIFIIGGSILITIFNPIIFSYIFFGIMGLLAIIASSVCIYLVILYSL